MFSRKPLFTVLALVVLGLTTAVSIGASTDGKHTMYVTFNRPVSLPGVTLGTGTYIFETPDPMSDHNLVRVLSRDRSIVILTTFTRPVERYAGMKRDQVISFGEAPGNVAQPITVWWPYDSAVGRQFVYPKR
jgi:hypothetical protein